MATLASLTEDVYDMLYGMAQIERPAEDTLTTAVTATTDTTWQFDTAMWKRGDYAEDATSGELVVLAADNTVGVDVTVRRGQRNTTALAAYAIGDVFYKNPTYPRHVIERFINETIDGDLWPNVWMVGETTMTYTSGDTTYQMPTDCGDVVQVYQYDLNSDGRFYPIDGTHWTFQGRVAAAVAANTNLLRIRSVHDETATVYVTYKKKPTSSSITDMSAQAAAIVPWGVVGKLLAGTRVTPVRTAPGRATPIANQSGSQLTRDYAAFDTIFRRMRKDERARLEKEVPIQKRWRGTRTRVF